MIRSYPNTEAGREARIKDAVLAMEKDGGGDAEDAAVVRRAKVALRFGLRDWNSYGHLTNKGPDCIKALHYEEAEEQAGWDAAWELSNIPLIDPAVAEMSQADFDEMILEGRHTSPSAHAAPVGAGKEDES